MTESKIYSGSVLVLGIVQFIESIAFTIPFSYFPNYAVSLGASVASIGLFTSSFMLAMAILSPKLGGLSDRKGRKKVMLFGLMGDIVLGILTGLAPVGDIIGPIIGTWLYDIYRFKTLNVGGLLLPGYGIPFFANSILGLISTLIILIFVKDRNTKVKKK